MASRGKKKTTMAKLSRESRLRERRSEKIARKEARKNAPPEEMILVDGILVARQAPDEDAVLEPDESSVAPSASASGPSLP
jgi:hypothetical protein